MVSSGLPKSPAQLESWEQPRSFEGASRIKLFSYGPAVGRPPSARQLAARNWPCRNEDATGRRRTGGNPRVHLGEESVLDRGPDVGIYGTDANSWKRQCWRILRKSQLWPELAVGQALRPRPGSRTVDVKRARRLATRSRRPLWRCGSRFQL